MNQGTNLGSQIGRWIVLAALVALLGALLLTVQPVFAQTALPGAPIDLMANPVGTQTIELDWTEPTTGDPFTGYKIERSTNNGTTWVDANANTGNDDEHYSDMHSSLAGKTVMYRVAAINAFGTGPVSVRASATPPVSGSQPNAPTGLMAVADGDTTVNLSWTAPARGATAIAGYTVQSSSDGKLPWTVVSPVHAGTDTTYTQTVDAGTTRHYRVAASNSAGMGPFSASVSVTTPPTGVPDAPTQLMANPVGTQTIELDWTPNPNSSYPDTGYKIERSTDNGTTWVVANANTGNDDAHYSDTHRSLAGKTVMYQVAAINIVGTGPVSDTTSTTPPVSGSQPNAPTGLMAVAADSTTINLTWIAPARGATAIAGYTVQSSSDGKLPWTPVSPVHAGTDTTYTQTVEAGTTHHYRVAASNSTGMGPFSRSVSEATPPTGVPGAPTDLMANPVGTQTIELDWTEPTTGDPFTGYKIERSTNNGTTWVDANANTGNDDEHYSDMHRSLAGKTVMYRVAAINAAGTGPVSNTTSATPPVSGAQPNAPTGLMAVADGDTTVNLSWTAPARGATAIAGYTVQSSSDGKLPWTVVSPVHAGTDTTYTQTVDAGTTRHYRVAASNSAGMGPFSASVSVTTPPTGVPDAPTQLMANPVGTQTIELDWTPNPNSSYPDTGYKIERSTDNGTTWVVANANTGNDDAHYSDTHRSLAGKTVMYQVAAINILGTGPVSDTTSTTPPVSGSQPNAPTGLTAVAAGPTTIILTWTAPARGSSVITGYTVQFSSDGKLPWTPVATVHAGTATIYTATGADAGTTRHYRVAASNIVGMGPFSTPAKLGPADQMGMVTLSMQEPMAGTRITANLTDADGMVSGQVWQWEKSMDMASWVDATGMGAMTSSYTPEAIDEGYYLRATVKYNDKYRSDRMAYSMATDAVTLPSDQMGTVTLSTQEPLVDMAITATLRDSDGMVSGQVWQWEKSMDMASWVDATGMGAMTSSYTPEAIDEGYYLRATVKYNDKYRSDRMASSMATDSMVVANNAPMFAEATADRSIEENSAAGAAVGDPVMATDADNDTLTHALSGDDAMYFSIDSGTGQIMVGMDTMLDYEAETTYMVTVTATDGSDAPNDSASIPVTINVTNVNEEPMFAEATADRSIEENSAEGTDVGAPVTATDPDAGDTLAYSLSGDDAMYFSIDGMGQIMVGADAMLDYETKMSYMVTVTATDREDLTDTIEVTINVTDVDENRAPMFAEATADRSIEENSEAGTAVGEPVTATDADGDMLTYALSGADAMYFTIDNMGQIKVGADAMLDYETKMSHMVTITATDPGGETDTIEVTINVTDVEENPLLVKYDRDGDGIDRGDVIAAIDRYFAEEPGVDRAEIIALIGLYFAS